MNRTEFLSELETLLSNISKEERDEAMEYYKGYFEDAGVEYEEDVIKELESPEKVAATILVDLKGEGKERAGDETKTLNPTLMAENNQNYKTDDSQEYTGKKAYEEMQKQNKRTRNILLIVIVVLTSPLWVGVLCGLAGVVIGIVAVVLSVAVVLAVLVVAFLVVGAVLIGVGIGRWITGGIATGFVLTGSGLGLIALSALSLILTVLYCGRFLPWAVKEIVNLCKKGFYAGKEKLA